MIEQGRPLTVKVHAAALLLGVSHSKLFDAIHGGSVHAIHIGKRLLIPTTELERLVGHEVSTRDLDWAAERVKQIRAAQYVRRHRTERRGVAKG